MIRYFDFFELILNILPKIWPKPTSYRNHFRRTKWEIKYKTRLAIANLSFETFPLRLTRVFYLRPTGHSPTKAATSSLYQNIAKFPPKLHEVKRHKLLSKLIGCFQYCPRVLDGHSNLVRECKSD